MNRERVFQEIDEYISGLRWQASDASAHMDRKHADLYYNCSLELEALRKILETVE